jgi:hypothetical protein
MVLTQGNGPSLPMTEAHNNILAEFYGNWEKHAQGWVIVRRNRGPQPPYSYPNAPYDPNHHPQAAQPGQEMKFYPGIAEGYGTAHYGQIANAPTAAPGPSQSGVRQQNWTNTRSGKSHIR